MAEETAAKKENVQVTPPMIKAGLEELRDFFRSGDHEDQEFLVSSIYMAMEYERREVTAPALRPRQSATRDG